MLVKRYDYLPFGEAIPGGVNGRSGLYSVGAFPVTGDGYSVKFTGKERDAESGLDYFGARYMSSAQGRFTTVDPENASASLFNPQAWNGYSYALNNPNKYVDPDGETPLLATAAIGAGIGAIGGGGFNLVSQLISNGGDLKSVDYRQVGSAALGGAVSGGIAGLTLGLGGAAVTITQAALANGAANVVGGAVTREANDLLGVEHASNEPSTGVAVATDFATGLIGGGTGARYGNVRYPLPNVRRELAIIANSSRRSLRPEKVAAFAQFANQQSLRNTVSGSVFGTSVTNFFSDLFFRVGNVFNPPAVQAKPKKKDYEVTESITYEQQ